MIIQVSMFPLVIGLLPVLVVVAWAYGYQPEVRMLTYEP